MGTIIQDSIPEPNESFLVNITNVRLANEADRQGSNTDSPRVEESRSSLQVVIGENDNNRGLLSFSVVAVSVMEEFGSTLTLQINRTRGTFGSVGVEYDIVDESTSSSDYSPISPAMVVFESGQEAATISIQISDDSIPEPDETFRVVLRNGTGGAEIGTSSSVTVTITRNDDINGVFSFGDSSLLVSITSLKTATLAHNTIYRFSFLRVMVVLGLLP
jgi:G-protein coupled receptor 98